MNEFDQFIKHGLKIKHYVRYTDDFIILSETREYLEGILPQIAKFLQERLRLNLHPKKVSIRTFNQGIDFLGYVSLPHHSVLRTKTKSRMWRNLRKRMNEYEKGIITKKTFDQTLQSYLGVLSHADAYDIRQEVLNTFGYSSWRID